jgi:predicted nucleic acid-binding protein
MHFVDTNVLIYSLGLSPDQEAKRVRACEVVILDAALATCNRYQISYADAAIIEAAQALGYRTVYSDGMRHGQDFGGVQVIDPFR